MFAWEPVQVHPPLPSPSSTPTAMATIAPSPTPSATATATATLTATPSGITLIAVGYQVQRRNTVDLSWSGATSITVEVYRNNALLTNTSNDGFYTDSIGKR